MQSFYFFAPPTRSERISSLCVGSRPASSLPSARMAEERPWDPWKQSMWVCGGTTTAGEAANVWAWDGQVIVTQRGTAREPKPTREAVFRRQPDIANDQGDVRPRTVGMPQNVDAQTPSCGFSLQACAPSCSSLAPVDYRPPLTGVLANGQGAAACVLKDRLYMIGGSSAGYGALSSVVSISKRCLLRAEPGKEEHTQEHAEPNSPTPSTWSERSPLQHLSQLPAKMQWRKEGASMNTRRDGVACCGYEDREGSGILMALGGCNGTGILSSVEQAWLSPSADGQDVEISNFLDLPDMPMKRTNATACALHGQRPGSEPYVHVIGGYTDGGVPTNRVHVLSHSSMKWDDAVPLHSARALHASCVYENRVFVAGGSDGQNALNSVESFDRREGLLLSCKCQLLASPMPGGN